MQWQEEQRKKREADLAAAAAEDKILAELAAAAAAEKSCYPLRLTQTSRHGCSMTSSPWDEILTAYKAGPSPSSGEAGKLRPPRAENPGLSCRGTEVRIHLPPARSPLRTGSNKSGAGAADPWGAHRGGVDPTRNRKMLWGGRRGRGNFVAASNRWSAAMPQPNDPGFRRGRL
jgi:hypothetical protein